MPFGTLQNRQNENSARCGVLPHPYCRAAAHFRCMSMLTPIPANKPFVQRAFFNIPVIGWLARDVMYGDHDNIYYLLVIILTLVIGAVSIWGLPALVVIAVSLVPIYFSFLIFVASPWMPND